METLYQTVKRSGISIPLEIMQTYGLQEGTGVLIELRKDGIHVIPAQVDVREIENRALRYLLRTVGDAVTIAPPQRNVAGDWEVDVFATESPIKLGQLVFTPAGILLPERSTPVEVFTQEQDAT